MSAENDRPDEGVTSVEPGCTCGGMAACPQCQERDAASAEKDTPELVERFWRTVGSREGEGWREIPGTTYTEAWVRACAAKWFPGEPLEYRETWRTPWTRVLPPGAAEPHSDECRRFADGHWECPAPHVFPPADRPEEGPVRVSGRTRVLPPEGTGRFVCRCGKCAVWPGMEPCPIPPESPTP